MKRTLGIVVAAAVVALPLVAEAAPKGKPKPKPTLRTVTWDYQGVGGTRGVPVSGTICANGMTCYDLTTEKYEKLVSFTSKDSTGRDAGFAFAINDVMGPTLCGKGVIAVGKGETVQVTAVATPDCQALPTTGTVTFTVTGLR